ncbi:MAG TPA: hypothetical protein V6D48_14320, partial [Oculatellaceae cyanobacterium]
LFPQLVGYIDLNPQTKTYSSLFPQMFGQIKMNPQHQLELETQSRSKALAEEEQRTLHQFNSDVQQRAINEAIRRLKVHRC